MFDEGVDLDLRNEPPPFRKRGMRDGMLVCRGDEKKEKVMAKIAIVTGASRGIGRSIAKRLAADGFSVVVNYAGNSAAAQEAVDEIRKADGEALAIKADVGNPTEVKQLFEKTIEAYGRVDVVVNNAGIMPLSPIAKGDVEAFDKVIATNLRGTFLILAQAAQHVAEGGRIIAFSSSVLAKSFPTYGPYIASKAGVEGLVPVLANELRGRNITVNAVAPGPTGTDLFLTGKSPEQIAQLSKLAPLERLGQPEDIANVVSFLAGPDGSWVNAQILRANGGFA
jgi:3-oxoacyl-[acyl-carrier protein] reductase